MPPISLQSRLSLQLGRTVETNKMVIKSTFLSACPILGRELCSGGKLLIRISNCCNVLDPSSTIFPLSFSVIINLGKQGHLEGSSCVIRGGQAAAGINPAITLTIYHLLWLSIRCPLQLFTYCKQSWKLWVVRGCHSSLSQVSVKYLVVSVHSLCSEPRGSLSQPACNPALRRCFNFVTCHLASCHK